MIELEQFRIGRRLALPVQPFQEMCGPFRKIDGARRQPFRVECKAQDIEGLTEQPLRYDFKNFTFVSRMIKKGNRLRLVISPAHSMYLEKNYNAGGVVAEESVKDARTVTVRLFHDKSHPSALYVPIGQP